MLRRAIVALFVVVSLVLGSGAAMSAEPAQPGAAGADGGAGADPAVSEASGESVESAIAEVPTNTATYRGDLLYPRFADETPHEAFMRLAEDFLYISEIGGNEYPGRVPLWPREAVKAGPFQLFPYLVGSLSWTNNVYQNETERSSWFWEAGAGLTGSAGFANGRGTFGFGVDYRYRDFLQESGRDYSEWVIGAHLGYTFPFGLWIKVGVKYEDLTQPIGTEYTGQTPRSNFIPFLNFGFNNAFGNKINIDFGIEYADSDISGQAYETAKRQATTVFVKVSYPFVKESSRVYIRYNYAWDHRPSDFQNQLNNGNQLVGGIEGAIPVTSTDKLVGFIEVGYQNASFSGPSAVTHNIATDDNSSNGTGVVRARLRYRMSPRASMDLSVAKDMTFSTKGNYQDRWYTDYNFTWNITKQLIGRGSAYLEWSEPSTDTPTTTLFGFGTGLRYLLTENFDLFTDANWSRRNTAQDGWDTAWFIWTFGVTIYMR